MENLKNYKNQIEEVQNLVNELENGTLSKEDLTRLESLTRMIHERSVILKYMAFGNISIPTDNKIEVDNEKTKIVEEKEEESISFEIPTKKEIEIDLFGDLSKHNEDDEVETPLSISDIIEDLQKEEPNYINEVVEKEIEEKINDELQKQELKEDVVEKIQEMELTEKVVDEMEEIEITEKVVVAMENEIPEPSVENNSFLDQLNLNDDSLHSMLNASKIETLVGAFSLNEKLRFMNDLFDGSSEDFNESVRTLDQESGKDAANSRINEFAQKYEWDSEDDAVTEFVSFINRRYA